MSESNAVQTAAQRIKEAGKSKKKALILSNIKLKELPDDIGSLTNLEILYLEGNELERLPKGIAKLKSLKALKLANNRFREFPAEALNLPNLEALDLSNNPLESMPPGIRSLKNLQILYLEKTGLSSLPAEIGELTNLSELFLADNHIARLPRRLGDLQQLGTLDLYGNPLEYPPAGMAEESAEAILAYLRDNEPPEEPKPAAAAVKSETKPSKPSKKGEPKDQPAPASAEPQPGPAARLTGAAAVETPDRIEKAFTLYRFFTHPETTHPVTAAVTDPNEGEAETFLRSVQSFFDPAHPRFDSKNGPRKDEKTGIRVGETLYMADHEPPASPGGDNGEGGPKPHGYSVWLDARESVGAGRLWGGLMDALVRELAERMPRPNRERFLVQLQRRRRRAPELRSMAHQAGLYLFWRSSPWMALAWLGATALAMAAAEFGYFPRSTAMLISWYAILFALVGTYALSAGRALLKPVSRFMPDLCSYPEYAGETAAADARGDVKIIAEVLRDPRRWFLRNPNAYTNPYRKHGASILVAIAGWERADAERRTALGEGIRALGGESGIAWCFAIASAPAAIHGGVGAPPFDLVYSLPEPEAGRAEALAEALTRPEPLGKAVDLVRRTIWAPEDGAAANAEPAEWAKSILSNKKIKNKPEGLATLVEDEARRRILLEQALKRFSDEGVDNGPVITETAKRLPGETAAVNRFVNEYRFRYVLWWIREKRREKEPELRNASVEQLARWIELTVRWPRFAGWLLNTGSNGANVGIADRLRMMEEIASVRDSAGLRAKWREVCKTNPDDCPWLADPQWLEFFRDEAGRKSGRLSEAAGTGLY